MKTILFIIMLALPSCIATTTTVTSPDGTVTVTKVEGIDAPTVTAVTNAVTAISVEPTK